MTTALNYSSKTLNIHDFSNNTTKNTTTNNNHHHHQQQQHSPYASTDFIVRALDP